MLFYEYNVETYFMGAYMAAALGIIFYIMVFRNARRQCGNIGVLQRAKEKRFVS